MNGQPSSTLAPRVVKLTTRTGIDIHRLLPHRDIRMVGAWCFLDYYGPTQQIDAMSVAAHPHTGLQTVSWLFSGEIEHCDSLQSQQRVFPGELNLMTAGEGVAHSELSLNHQVQLHGVQLWVALPNHTRNMPPRFSHYSGLPVFQGRSYQAKVIIGEFLGLVSPAETFSEIVAAEIIFSDSTEYQLPINSDFEYGMLLITGEVSHEQEVIPERYLRYIKPGGNELNLEVSAGARILLLGGRPFEEEIVMWWNFIGRSHDDILQMRNDWESGSNRFAAFNDQLGGRIPAPMMPNIRLTSRGRQRAI